MELSHLDPFTLADSGDYPPLVVVNEVRTLKIALRCGKKEITLAIRRRRTQGSSIPQSWRLPWPANCAAGPFAAGLHGMRFQ
jgi:hypothetical protein